MSEATFPVPVKVDADKGAPPRNRPGLGIRIRRRLPGIASVLMMAFALLILFGPVLMLALFSFNDSSIISLPWEGFTTRWYEAAWDSAEAKDAILNSLLVASLVTIGSLVLGTLAAWGLTRLRFPGRGALAGLHGSVLVVPWLIVGVAGLIFFSQIGIPLSLTVARIEERAEDVAAEIPVAQAIARALAIVEPAVGAIGLGPAQTVNIVAIECLADEGRFAAEGGNPDHGVGNRAAGHLHTRSHGRVQRGECRRIDELHAAFAAAIARQEGVIAAADDVDNGIADPDHVVLLHCWAPSPANCRVHYRGGLGRGRRLQPPMDRRLWQGPLARRQPTAVRQRRRVAAKARGRARPRGSRHASGKFSCQARASASRAAGSRCGSSETAARMIAADSANTRNRASKPQFS